MAAASPEKASLITAARAQNAIVTPKQIDRWRADDLLPKAIPHGRGRARGIGRASGEDTLRQLLALVAILKGNRSLDYAAFRLWVRGYRIPIARVRRALENLVVKKFETARNISGDEFHDAALGVQERLARRRSAPKRSRQMANAGRLAPVLEFMLGLAGGVPAASKAAEQKFAQDFAELASLEKAKSGVPSLGIDGWLKTNPTESIVASMQLAASLPDTVRNLTEDEMNVGRELFCKYERITIAFQFVQKAAKDDAAMGTTLLTRSIVGLDIEHMGPDVFTVMAVIQQHVPDVAVKINAMWISAEGFLEKLEQAGIPIPQY